MSGASQLAKGIDGNAWCVANSKRSRRQCLVSCKRNFSEFNQLKRVRTEHRAMCNCNSGPKVGWYLSGILQCLVHWNESSDRKWIAMPGSLPLNLASGMDFIIVLKGQDSENIQIIVHGNARCIGIETAAAILVQGIDSNAWCVAISKRNPRQCLVCCN